MAGEAALIVGAAAAGVPVAPLVATGDASSPLGAPFMILGHVDGETIPRQACSATTTTPRCGRAGLTAGAILAAIHRIDPPRAPTSVEQDQVRQFVELLDLLGRAAPRARARLPMARRQPAAERPERRSSTATSAPAT